MIRLPNGAYANPEHVSAIREHASDSKTTVIAFISGDTIELPLITTDEANSILFPCQAAYKAGVLKEVRHDVINEVIAKVRACVKDFSTVEAALAVISTLKELQD